MIYLKFNYTTNVYYFLYHQLIFLYPYHYIFIYHPEDGSIVPDFFTIKPFFVPYCNPTVWLLCKVLKLAYKSMPNMEFTIRRWTDTKVLSYVAIRSLWCLSIVWCFRLILTIKKVNGQRFIIMARKIKLDYRSRLTSLSRNL